MDVFLDPTAAPILFTFIATMLLGLILAIWTVFSYERRERKQLEDWQAEQEVRRRRESDDEGLR